ncbi:DUF3883 domain-containing protein [Polaribacter sp. Z014]|uniref:protein NO VEIN domain-containing protein n=1 Tax=Polaribacter sp. Z014 TaxID=2927126 RepID=UPI0020212930|nr:DUF3883 domain-containing protein [Polaribacter sp. Z014]MCL7765064.1 DUF3883 domain-containing protein [Polaribacter sp. Z014]
MNNLEKDINKVFQNHYDFHRSIGADFVKSDSGHINQVSADYQGRVLYELLQNAFDRAEKKIIVKVIGKSLFVANDGKRFTYNAEHDYINGGRVGEKFERCDFQSLCSISTSNKTANESIGNKGVGFKSVYALGRYANIYTKGIINPSTEKKEAEIAFRLYDIFDDVDTIPNDFIEEIKKHITKAIGDVKREFSDRGLPGYYFPLQLNEENNKVFNNFDKDIVTIIEVPFQSKDEVDKLLNEIESIHFGFVGLKYENDFDIKFETEESSFIKNTSTTDETLFSAKLDTAKMQLLAEKAGVNIKEPEVAIKFKNEPSGLFYNYLPTKKESPFKYVDFHADFHTTVDRKDINFDGDKVGAYNRALLEACVELYFKMINNSLSINKQVSLNLRYIIGPGDIVGLKEFNWHLLESNNAYKIFKTVKSILSIWNYEYDKASNLLANLALQFFNNKREIKEHEVFFKTITDFINYFSRDDGDRWKWPDLFKECLAGKLLNENVQFLPGINLKEGDIIIYQKNEDKKIELPDSIPIKITNFDIKDFKIKDKLTIKDYTQSNEILKYFRQCSFSGVYSRETIGEENQKHILKSCYELYLSKDKKKYLSSHRYATAFTTDLRKQNSTSNQANFNISTLFLKQIDGKYKPAQLCKKTELDLEFLDFLEASEVDNWLRFMGVSTETNTRFLDLNIYNQLGDGVRQLPKLLTKGEHKEEVSGKLLENVRILNSNKKLTHPSVINDNNYSFLENISNNKLKPELDNLLVKNYNDFPNQYLKILRERLEPLLATNKKSIIQFYQNVFEVFALQDWYLVIKNNKLKWIQEDNFHILSNKVDFELCAKQFPSKAILAYYSGKLKESLKEKLVKLTKGKIKSSNVKINLDLKSILVERLPFILINLSYSKNSESDYLSENANLSTLQMKFESMSIYECAMLTQELNFEKLGSDVSPKSYAYNENELFISSTSTKSQQIQGVCDFLFNNISIKDQVELIVFHKELDELRKETDIVELGVINRKWKPDYQEKYVEFQTKILSFYNRNLDSNVFWYKYNEEEQNEFLIELDKANKINELESLILQSINEYEDYFDGFQLEIDYSHIIVDIAFIQAYIDSAPLEEKFEKKLLGLIRKAEKRTLGIEDEIRELKSDFPHIFVVNGNENELKTKQDEINNVQKIENIYAKLKLGRVKFLEHNNLVGANKTNIILPINSKQIIFQGTADKSENNLQLEITGACGEVEVLICLINEFIQLNKEERKKGIKAIKDELSKHMRDTSFFDKYAEDCIEVIEDTAKLSKALIPLFFVSRKYKYANFDLITYRKGSPTLIEVKTTSNMKSKSFFISIAEVNKARVHPNYEIVRVTPKSIIFMGNPIKKISKKIQEIQTDGFTLTPRNFELIIN